MHELWQRIMTWLKDNAPALAAVIREPAPSEHVERLRRRFGVPLPADLVAWWAEMDGIDDNAHYRNSSLIPPFYAPLPVAAADEAYVQVTTASALAWDCCTPDGHHRHQAGQSGMPYCTALVPIARALDGGMLCVDLRPGDKHGCVMVWFAEDGFHESDWIDVTAMLTEIADRFDDLAHWDELADADDSLYVDEDGVLHW